MRKEIGELVPIKLIKRIIRNYGKSRKLVNNTKMSKSKIIKKRSIAYEFV